MLPRTSATLLIFCILTATLGGASAAAASSAAFGPAPCLGGWVVGTRSYAGDAEIAAVCATDLSRVVRITNWPGRDARPTLSPSGDILAFGHLDGSQWSVWFLDLRTLELTSLPRSHPSEIPNTWKDESTLVYAASQSSIYCWDSWTYSRATGARAAITTEGASGCNSSGSATWVADHSTYYYTSEFSTEIRARTATGALLPSPANLADCNQYPHLNWLRFSSTHTLAVYCHGPNELRFLDAKTFATKHPRILMPGTAPSYAWSPDGTRIAVDLQGTGQYALVEPATGASVPFVSMLQGETVEWWGASGPAAATLDAVASAIAADGGITRALVTTDGDLTRARVTTEGNATRASVAAEGDLTRARVTTEASAIRAWVTAEADATRAEVQAGTSAVKAAVLDEGDRVRADLREEGVAIREHVSTEAGTTRDTVSDEADATREHSTSLFASLATWLGDAFEGMRTWLGERFTAIEARFDRTDAALEDIKTQLDSERAVAPLDIDIESAGIGVWYALVTLQGDPHPAEMAADGLVVTPVDGQRGLYRIEGPPAAETRMVIVTARNATHMGGRLLVVPGVVPEFAGVATPGAPPPTPTQRVVLYENEWNLPATPVATPGVPALLRVEGMQDEAGRYEVRATVAQNPSLNAAFPNSAPLPPIDLWLLALPPQGATTPNATVGVRLSYAHEPGAARCEAVGDTCVPLPVGDPAWLAGEGPQRTSFVVEAWLETMEGERRTERVEVPLAGQVVASAP